jgi:glutamyl-tRNA synthetase
LACDPTPDRDGPRPRPAPPLRALAHRLPARRRRAHRAVQLALGAQDGGQFLLRIEDTDRARSTDASTAAIFEGLEWLGLDWDEPPVYQGANLERHQVDGRRLLDGGAAYRCFCTAAELDQQRQAAEARGDAFRYDRRCDRLAPDEVRRRMDAGDPFVVRFRMPEGETSWVDLVHGRITFPNEDVGEGDFIVLRSDGTPIYNMAVVSDDIAMRITLVMRGDDHISNTPKQILIFQALGAELPQFAHLPMIHGTDGKKLSKRHGATAVGDYQHLGILADAMTNFLALLGWSPGGDREVMTRDELIALFGADGLSRKAAVFDPQKLEWMNGQHLMLMPLPSLAPRVAAAMEAAGLATAAELEARPEWFARLLELLRVRSRTVDELVRQAVPYLRESLHFDPDAVAKQWMKDPAASHALLGAAGEALSELPAWEAAAMEVALRAVADRQGVGAGKLFQPLRVALTGVAATPGIFDVLELLGRERSLARIVDAQSRLAVGR